MTSSITRRSVQCIVCDGGSWVKLYRAQDHHYGNPGRFQLVRCSSCGLASIDPLPSEEELSSYYPPSYYAHSSFDVPSRSRQLLNKLLLSDITTKDPQFPKPGRMLDVGCGTGIFLYQMQQKGWKVQGVEPDPAAVEIGRQHGIEMFCGTLEQADFPAASFDYVRLNHSFEHIRDPIPVLCEIRRILRPDGKLFIAVPDFASTTARWFGEYWWFLGLPVHVFQYSSKTLPALLNRYGFEVERIHHNSHFGPLLGSLQILLNRRRDGIRSTGLLTDFGGFRVLGNWAATIIDLIGTGHALEVTAKPRPI